MANEFRASYPEDMYCAIFAHIAGSDLLTCISSHHPQLVQLASVELRNRRKVCNTITAAHYAKHDELEWMLLTTSQYVTHMKIEVISGFTGQAIEVVRFIDIYTKLRHLTIVFDKYEYESFDPFDVDLSGIRTLDISHRVCDCKMVRQPDEFCRSVRCGRYEAGHYVECAKEKEELDEATVELAGAIIRSCPMLHNLYVDQVELMIDCASPVLRTLHVHQQSHKSVDGLKHFMKEFQREEGYYGETLRSIRKKRYEYGLEKVGPHKLQTLDVTMASDAYSVQGLANRIFVVMGLNPELKRLRLHVMLPQRSQSARMLNKNAAFYLEHLRHVEELEIDGTWGNAVLLADLPQLRKLRLNLLPFPRNPSIDNTSANVFLRAICQVDRTPALTVIFKRRDEMFVEVKADSVTQERVELCEQLGCVVLKGLRLISEE